MRFSLDKSKISAIVVMILMITSVSLITMPIKAQLAAQQPVSGPLPAGVTVDNTEKTQAFY